MWTQGARREGDEGIGQYVKWVLILPYTLRFLRNPLELYGAVVSGRVLSGRRSGRQAVRVVESGHSYEEKSSPRCVNVNGSHFCGLPRFTDATSHEGLAHRVHTDITLHPSAVPAGSLPLHSISH